jgi:hypothetical protein
MANVKISAMTSLSSVVDSTTIPVISSGTNYKITASQIKTYMGLGNIATINKDGNSSNVLYGNGIFASAPATYGNSNVASYLVTNPPAGSYSNTNVSSYLSTYSSYIANATHATVANSANAVAWSNVSGTPTTLSGYGITDSYSNTNVFNYLSTFTGNIKSGNANLGNIVFGNYFAGTTGNIVIQATGGTPKNWKFDIDGNLTLPGNNEISINYANGSSLLKDESSFEAKSTNFNALSGHRYGIDTSGGIVNATLPSSPNIGDAIYFIDFGGAFSTNNFNILRNGKTIMNQTSDLIVSKDGQLGFGLAWSGATWRLY